MNVAAWGGFLLLIAVLLALDLGVFHKTNETPSAKSALKWTGVWFSVAMVFNVCVYFLYEKSLLGLGGRPGKDAAMEFFTGYIVEQSLSLDNIFVMALIFKFFKIQGDLQHRVLFWGILGAIVLRISMILLGAALIDQFKWTLPVFGLILCYTAIKMALSKGDDDFDPGESFIVKTVKRFIPIAPEGEGSKFFIKRDGKNVATPLFLVLLVIEGSDVVFAIDSIPAVFGVTRDAFIVFTSNIFAILGLRSLYFALASLLRQFAYLKYSLIVVLFFVGVKMLLPVLGDGMHISSTVSLIVIVGLLALGVLASSFLKRGEPESEEEPALPEGGASPKLSEDLEVAAKGEK